ncbi:hypothetical protein EGW08_012664 [Elysia chlorotica]|uniref:Uncharacterized protein n=1 Tax=Elysia chlorotica TaxID=188477 RepID=A0A433TDI7_ELYCH|nr:hypothetical protein EGW08_012664 [Elysia chlorotica]
MYVYNITNRTTIKNKHKKKQKHIKCIFTNISILPREKKQQCNAPHTYLKRWMFSINQITLLSKLTFCILPKPEILGLWLYSELNFLFKDTILSVTKLVHFYTLNLFSKKKKSAKSVVQQRDSIKVLSVLSSNSVM